MADGTEVLIQTEEQAQIEQNQSYLKEMMEISLNGGIPKLKEDPIDAANTQIDAANTQNFQFETFKEKFGYENPEQILQEIEELRNLKANPPKADIKYENEESELIAKALGEGKIEDVYNVLYKKMQLDKLVSQEVTADNADDFIKMSMKYTYDSLNEDQIQHKFNRQYHIPKEPVQKSDEYDDVFSLRHEEWEELVKQVEMDKIIDAKMALPNLQKAKKEIVYPKIESPVDEAYLEWQKSLENAEKQDKLTREAYNNLTSKEVETKMRFIDEANKIDFEFQFQPDEEGFKKAVDVASNMDNFFKTFFDSDGNPNRQMFVDAIYYSMFKQKIFTEAIKQGSNARIKAALPDNSDNGLNRQNAQNQEPSELDRLMKQSLGI